MENKKPGVDIINEVLEACILAYPVSSFIISLYKQYISRGWLTKKQLQGLHGKAQQINDLPPGKLAALEAIMLDEGGLHRMQLLALRETFDGRDLVAFHSRGEKETGIHPPAIDEHGAGAALAMVAAFLRAGEVEMLAQGG